MRVHEKRAWADGDTVTPEEINAEFNHQFSVLNGNLDSDNIPADTIETEKVRANTFNIIKRIKRTSAQSAYVLRETTTRGQVWLDIPDLEFDLLTDDGRMVITAELYADVHLGDEGVGGPSAGPAKFASSAFSIGIMVDNQLIGRTGVNATMGKESMSLTVAAPMGAGTHTIKAVVRVAPTDGVPPGENRNINCLARILWVRFQRR